MDLNSSIVYLIGAILIWGLASLVLFEKYSLKQDMIHVANPTSLGLRCPCVEPTLLE